MTAACVLPAAFPLACGEDNQDFSTGERLLLIEAEAHSFEESVETLYERDTVRGGAGVLPERRLPGKGK